ncbi:hypothetical protein [Paraburkholderia sp. MM5384-R2]|uniref:hypothetical protein n=1 Tax=Paraburkholderia sp. MM5384-R2 TaxID=2723097 RepID=UPI0016078D26|nr:hypothetical protein [Paraburkholderia sp. MM5384-R2]MBB5501544.1 hypothetical protein [Paraburkholderia sp. MM5384-R2]
MIERPEHNNPDDRLYQNAGSLIVSAHQIWDELGVVMDLQDFIDGFVYTTRDYGEPTARQFFDEYAKSVETTGEENSREQRFVLVRLACAHIGDALRFADDGFRDDAWEALLMAQHTTATLEGVIKTEKKSPEISGGHIHEIALAKAQTIISERARNAADKRHTENRALRDDAIEWLKQHYEADKLTDERAAENLGRIVPVGFDARLGYVKTWKKTR